MIDQSIPLSFAVLIVFVLMYTNGVLSAPPSEFTLLSAGVWVALTGGSIFSVLIAAFIGNLLGASTLYLIGYWLGERRTVRLITQLTWILSSRYGTWWRYRYTRNFLRVTAVRNPIFLYAVCRSLPVVRSIVSLPAGVERFPFFRFIIYSGLGISIWCAGWIFAGYKAGDAEANTLQRVFVIAALVVMYIFLKRIARDVSAELRRTGPA